MVHGSQNRGSWASWGPTIIFSEKKSPYLNNLSLDPTLVALTCNWLCCSDLERENLNKLMPDLYAMYNIIYQLMSHFCQVYRASDPNGRHPWTNPKDSEKGSLLNWTKMILSRIRFKSDLITYQASRVLQIPSRCRHIYSPMYCIWKQNTLNVANVIFLIWWACFWHKFQIYCIKF